MLLSTYQQAHNLSLALEIILDKIRGCSLPARKADEITALLEMSRTSAAALREQIKRQSMTIPQPIASFGGNNVVPFRPA